MSNSMRDPYFQARQELLQMMQQTNQSYDRWQKLQQTENTSRSQEFAGLTREIKESIKKINVDLTNLQQVITVVQSNRAAFPSIDDNELNGRKQLVADIAKRTKEIDNSLNAQRTARAKAEGDKRRDLLGTGSSASSGSSSYYAGGARSGLDRAREADALDVVERKRHVAQEREKAEDEVLESMSEALSRLNITTEGIGSDLKTHSELISGLSTEVEGAQSAMDVTLVKIDALLGQSRKGRYCCIFMLFIIIVALFFCIIYI